MTIATCLCCLCYTSTAKWKKQKRLPGDANHAYLRSTSPTVRTTSVGGARPRSHTNQHRDTEGEVRETYRVRWTGLYLWREAERTRFRLRSWLSALFVVFLLKDNHISRTTADVPGGFMESHKQETDGKRETVRLPQPRPRLVSVHSHNI